MQVSFVLLDLPGHDMDAQAGKEDNISLQVECGA
jgi:hypothetical protein